jgi:uncharacterized protein (UPF0276 family)
VGLRSTHYSYLESGPRIAATWFEAISENYMDSWGKPREMLRMIRADYPVALHGVSMSLLSPEGIRADYLARLKQLISDIEPRVVSDHLCWTGRPGQNLHDLLPFPFTEEAFEVAVKNIDHAQTFLGREIAFENVSTYLSFKDSEMTEWEFIARVAKTTGAKILLDINNVYVSAVNHGFDPKEFLAGIPNESVAQIHLAGHTDTGTFLFDTHSKPVANSVWDLFSAFIKDNPYIPYMIEWDEDIPEFETVMAELNKATALWEVHHGK